MKLLLQPSLGLSLISRPMLGCLDQVARPPSHKNGSKQSKSTQIRVSGRSPAPKCVGFCRGILGFTRWVPCDWANCSKSGIFAPILVGERQFWPFSGFGNLVSGQLHAGKGVCFQHVKKGDLIIAKIKFGQIKY